MTSPRLTRFRVHGLHGRMNFDIPIQDNVIVLVGVNGLGKTTLINLLFYSLAQKWHRLLDYQFDSITLEIDGTVTTIPSSVITDSLSKSSLTQGPGRLPARIRHRLESDWTLYSRFLEQDPRVLPRLQEELQVPAHLLRVWWANSPERESSSGELRELEEGLRTTLAGQVVLYLPTYRRIERDLETILPGLEDEIQRYRSQQTTQQPSYLELVEFGMRDVEKRLEDLLTALREQARLELNSLAASYLSEVIRGEAHTYDRSLISRLDDAAVARILSRVESGELLKEPEKVALRDVIRRLRATEDIDARDQYVGHFFSKLVLIHETLLKGESAVEQFVEVCNRYLEGKRLVFDDRLYSLEVRADGAASPLEMKQLSSGEKQIVSLFAHVYLGDLHTGLMVLIDEPEMSLSVKWQQQLLPDLRRSPRCRFLAAATHSPFVFDNELDPHTRDLRSFSSRS